MTAPAVLSGRGLKKYFPIREGAIQRVVGHVKAVDGVSFDVLEAETLGIVGESGCGKTTLGRCIAGLSAPTEGGVYFRMPADAMARRDALMQIPGPDRSRADQRELAALEARYRVDLLSGEARRDYRRNCQIVFQDAYSSLNPRHLVKDIVGRPLKVYHEASGRALQTKVLDLLHSVGLGAQHLLRYPHEFSGGQQQRISIARALALDPAVIVLDEPTSALDVSVQAQILNLLHELQRERHLSYVFVSHDLGVVQHVSDRTLVMYLGEVVEEGPTDRVFRAPRHPYTEALIRANPALTDSSDADELRGLEGSVPDPAAPPQGCRFHTRCPVAFEDCGWDLEDGLDWLTDHVEIWESVQGVERTTPFKGTLAFDDENAAVVAQKALSDQAPAPLRAALVELDRSEAKLHLRFKERDGVHLGEVEPGHRTSCLLQTEGVAEVRIDGVVSSTSPDRARAG